ELRVLVEGEHRAGAGVDLVVILLVVLGVELHVVDLPAVVPLQVAAHEGHLAGGEARVGECLGLGLLGADQAAGGAGAGAAGIGGGSGAGAAGAEGVRVGDQAAAGEGDGAGGAVPADLLAHQLPDGPDGQVVGALVEHGVHGLALGVLEVPDGAVHHDGEV